MAHVKLASYPTLLRGDYGSPLPVHTLEFARGTCALVAARCGAYVPAHAIRCPCRIGHPTQCTSGLGPAAAAFPLFRFRPLRRVTERRCAEHWLTGAERRPASEHLAALGRGRRAGCRCGVRVRRSAADVGLLAGTLSRQERLDRRYVEPGRRDESSVLRVYADAC